jgi:fumarate hydratase class II
LFSEKLNGLEANIKHTNLQLEKNPMTAKRLVPKISYDKTPEITQVATKSGKTIKQVIFDMKSQIKGKLGRAS